MVSLSPKTSTKVSGNAFPLCPKHFKNTKEILKNTKEKLNHHNYEFLRGKTDIYEIVRPWAAFLWSLRFIWYPYWHNFECQMTYAICVIYANNAITDRFDIPSIRYMTCIYWSIWVSTEVEGPKECRPYKVVNCQNHNSTTTQPQDNPKTTWYNSTKVGFDMIIGLHHHHPTPPPHPTTTTPPGTLLHVRSCCRTV